MKQHITEKQWLEACSRGIKYSVCYEEHNLMFPMDIGQMIEFLGDDWVDIFAGGWKGVKYEYKAVSTNNLCDALWEAVKYKLNQTT